MCNHGILSSSEYMFFLQVLTFELCIYFFILTFKAYMYITESLR